MYYKRALVLSKHLSVSETLKKKMNFNLIVFVTLFVIVANEAKVLNNNSNTCQDLLGDELIEEIWSYENVKDEILRYVLDGDFKGKTYDEYVFMLVRTQTREDFRCGEVFLVLNCLFLITDWQNSWTGLEHGRREP